MQIVVAQWLERLTGVQKVEDLIPVWDSEVASVEKSLSSNKSIMYIRMQATIGSKMVETLQRFLQNFTYTTID